MQKDQIVEKIYQAFKDGKYPGDTNIVYDNTGTHLECELVKKEFIGQSWENLSESFLFENSHAISFFSKEGFKYFVPAFIIFSVKKFHEADDISDMLIGKLTLPLKVDTIILANAIKRYQIDRKITNINYEEFLISQLEQHDNKIYRFIEYMTIFNAEQKSAIKEFIEFMIEYSDNLYYSPKNALERYWFQF